MNTKNEDSVQYIMNWTRCNREKAMFHLEKNKGDLLLSVVEITEEKNIDIDIDIEEAIDNIDTIYNIYTVYNITHDVFGG
jgi:hypothetical protein